MITIVFIELSVCQLVENVTDITVSAVVSHEVDYPAYRVCMGIWLVFTITTMNDLWTMNKVLELCRRITMRQGAKKFQEMNYNSKKAIREPHGKNQKNQKTTTKTSKQQQKQNDQGSMHTCPVFSRIMAKINGTKVIFKKISKKKSSILTILGVSFRE